MEAPSDRDWSETLATSRGTPDQSILLRQDALSAHEEADPVTPDFQTLDAGTGGAAPGPLAAHPGGEAIRDAYLREAAGRLSAALFHIVHQSTSKGRDRALAALVALIYGPTPFGGVNTLKEVATRYGMTEQNLFHLMRTHRELLAGKGEPDYEI